MEVYLDNSATTKCFDEVAELMTRIMCEDYGNPSSLHRKGVQAEQYIRYAKETVAQILKVNEKEIFFTSGGTESDNLAIRGCAYANCRAGRHLITTQIEHPAVLKTMKHLEEEGFRVTYLPVDRTGCVQLSELHRAITGETILVSMMHTNNEVGTLQPVSEAGLMIKQMNPRILFHVDAVQGFGKFRIHPKKMNIDLLSVSGHKIHGPKGVGFLYVDEKVKIKPIVFGGGQQSGLRSGTDNVPGIAGMARAAEMIYGDLDRERERLYELKEAEFPNSEMLRELERVFLLKVIDRKWMDHIDDMDQLRQGIGLQAFAQRDPLVEYKLSGYEMFSAMTSSIQEETVRILLHVRVEEKAEREQVAKVTGTNKDTSLAKAPKKRESEKIYPNDPCPCGSGKKYKQCCGRK